MELITSLVPGVDLTKLMLQKEDAPPTAEIGGLEIPLDVPKIMSAEAAATANATGILGLGGGGNKFQAKKDDDAIPRRKLEVMIFTSDIDHGGTDDTIYIYFIGDLATEGPVSMSKNWLSKENRTSGSVLFQKGSIDTFEVEVMVGELKQIVVGKEPSANGWHLLKVIVTDTWDGTVLCFPCEQWLANSRIALGNEVLLYGWDYDPSELEYRVVYKVIVSTANVPGASCHANAYIAIYGDKGQTGKKWLGHKRHLLRIVTKSGAVALPKGETVAFLIDSFDVGEIKRIRIGHDNRGIGDQRWKLDWIRVEKHYPNKDGGVLNPRDRPRFVYNGWLGYGGEDSLCEITLYPDAKSLEQSMKRIDVDAMKLDTENAVEEVFDIGQTVKNGGAPTQKWKYKVLINTSDIPNADYDGDACIELYGSGGKTSLFEVSGPFKRGAAKEFEDFSPPIGRIEELMLYAKNFGDAWHLQDIFVEVLNERNKQVGAYTFQCERWINSYSQPKSVLLLSHDESQGQKEQWKILVYTSELPGSSTKDNVYISLQGKEAKSRFLHLKASGNIYKKGMVMQFFRTTERLGTLRTIIIAIDGKRTGHWFPDQIEVVNLQKNEVYMFANSEPLVVKKSKGGEKKWAKKMLRLVQINPNAIKQAGLKCRYKAVFYTSDTENSETSSDVSFVVSGDQGESGKVLMRGGSRRFNKGQTDAVFFDAPNVGDMYKLRLALETRLPTSWLCTYAHLVNIRTGAQAVFVPGGCLATTTGTERYKTIVAAGKGVPPSISFYKIVVCTGTAKESNVNSVIADVTLEIYGSNRTVTAALEPDGDEIAFERGDLNVFTIESPNAGTIDNATISLNGKGKKLKWDLKYIEIIDPKVQEGIDKLGGGAAAESGISDLISQWSGQSIYMENKNGIIDSKDQSKRRLKKSGYPRGFLSLRERLESKERAGNKKEDTKEEGGLDIGLPKPGMFSLMRMV